MPLLPLDESNGDSNDMNVDRDDDVGMDATDAKMVVIL